MAWPQHVSLWPTRAEQAILLAPCPNVVRFEEFPEEADGLAALEGGGQRL